MNFSVVWPDAMINSLAPQYVRARHSGFGSAFAQAIHRAEQRLANDPISNTESRDSTYRVIIEPPVTLYYRIDSDRSQVTIIGVYFAEPRTR
jgi:hypothetical protein